MAFKFFFSCFIVHVTLLYYLMHSSPGNCCNCSLFVPVEDILTKDFQFLFSAATTEALIIPQISHSQQECGQLFPAQQWRLTNTLRPHHHSSTHTVSSPFLRVPFGLRAFSLSISIYQSQPFIVITFPVHQSFTVRDLQDSARQDPLFPGACLP